MLRVVPSRRLLGPCWPGLSHTASPSCRDCEEGDCHNWLRPTSIRFLGLGTSLPKPNQGSETWEETGSGSRESIDCNCDGHRQGEHRLRMTPGLGPPGVWDGANFQPHDGGTAGCWGREEDCSPPHVTQMAPWSTPTVNVWIRVPRTPGSLNLE